MSMILFLNIVSKKKKIVEILEFDLTTLGFNVQNTLVPSRTLNRVPTVTTITVSTPAVNDLVLSGLVSEHTLTPSQGLETISSRSTSISTDKKTITAAT